MEYDDWGERLLRKHGIAYPYGGFVVGKGWKEIVERLFLGLAALGWDKDLHQVKEKFGRLRVYIGAGNDELQWLIDGAENQSGHTCEDCGSVLGRLRGKYWFVVRCDKCQEAHEQSTRLGS